MKFGPLEIILILVVVLIIFGVGKLPQVGGALGKSIREFKKSAGGEDEGKQTEVKAEAKVAEAKVTEAKIEADKK